MIFLCQSSVIHTSVDIHIDIQARIYPCKDILQWMSVEHEYLRMDIHVFIDISLQLSMLLLIFILVSINFYGYPCMDLL